MPLKTLGNHHHDFYLLNKVGRWKVTNTRMKDH
jgi:hypothetical protein